MGVHPSIEEQIRYHKTQLETLEVKRLQEEAFKLIREVEFLKSELRRVDPDNPFANWGK